MKPFEIVHGKADTEEVLTLSNFEMGGVPRLLLTRSTRSDDDVTEDDSKHMGLSVGEARELFNWLGVYLHKQ